MRQRSLPMLAVSILIALALLATACSSDDEGTASGERTAEPGGENGGEEGEGTGDDPDESTNSEGAAAVTVSIEGDNNFETEVTIDLAESNERPDDAQLRTRTVDGSPLTAPQANRLLDRLPPLEAQESDQVDYARPVDTRLPPRTSETVERAFPPEIVAPPVAETPDGPLEVLRYQPEGPVDTAPFIAVTFNKPMVPLTTVDQLEALDVPISVSPEMSGRWIWLGTRTVRFEHEVGAIDRLPKATEFTVEIPTGTTAQDGSELAETVSFSFSTPAAEATDIYPLASEGGTTSRSQSLPTDQLFLVSFNQRVDAEEVIDFLELRVNDQRSDLRLATQAEIEADEVIARRIENALADRWVVVRAEREMAGNAGIVLSTRPGLPSAEGPTTSETIASFNGRTYGPFEVSGRNCQSRSDCEPGSGFWISMSNPIATDSFDASMISVEPQIPAMAASVSYNQIYISGRSAGQTDYRVTLDGELTDVFDQVLGEDEELTFRVGDARPRLFHPGKALITLDPIVDNGVFNVTSINHDQLDVTVYSADPATGWNRFQENSWEMVIEDSDLGFTVAEERTVTTTGDRNEFADTAIDLSHQLADNGHAIVVVRPPNAPSNERNQAFAVWIQRTNVGLDIFSDNETTLARVTDLRTGQPISDAEVQTLPGQASSTDDDGIAAINLGNNSRGAIATVDGRSTLNGEFWGNPQRRSDETRWYVIDDRGLYKPGETASIKGWVRVASYKTPSRLSYVDVDAKVVWNVHDAFGNEIAQGETELSPAGGFDLAIELPDDITLGRAGIEFQLEGDPTGRNYHYHELNVQEFRRPDFEVGVETATPGPYVSGETATALASAEYFAGGPLNDAEVNWDVAASAGSYSPPNWDGYTFGIWQPWWFFGDFLESSRGFGGGFEGGALASESLQATTDSSGEHGLDLTVTTEGKPRPVSVRANATVFDVNRQPITGLTNLLVHPSELYIGLKGSRTFVRVGDVLVVDAIVTDIDGVAVDGTTAAVELLLKKWEFRNGSWQQNDELIDTCEFTTSADPHECTLTPTVGGSYRVVARVADQSGRENLTELTRWVAGGVRPADRRVQLEELTLVPDAQEYQPGDTAELLVQSPFNNAHGLAIITRGTIASHQTIDFDDDGSAVLEVPISGDDIPAIGVQIEVVGTSLRSPDTDTLRPAFASGSLTLSVPATSRELTVTATPTDDVLTPGGETTLDVAVTDAEGDPVVGAEMVVIVVDEAVLSLVGYELKDPLAAFYQRNGGWLQAFRGRTSLRLADPDLNESGSGGGGFDDEAAADEAMEDAPALAAAGAEADFAAPQAERTTVAQNKDAAGEADTAIELRSDFEALAVFEPEVLTGPDGRATVEVPLPDNLTRYRVMVVAAADADLVGSGESNVTARLPITVRPTPPRFANFGDVFEFPVVVQNATDADRDIDVALRSTNLLSTGRSATSITVPANDRVEVRFEVAADRAGTARYQVVAVSGEDADAANGSFPVYTPATTEAFATYGVVDGGPIGQTILTPADVYPQFGGLEVTTSSTAVSALTDAVLYLQKYRYGNTDSYASRIMAIVSLGDILAAFETGDITPDQMRRTIDLDLEQLSNLQNNDGGFPWWRRGRESVPYVSVQAAHAMVLAQAEDYPINDETLARALEYLRNIEQNFPSYYSQTSRDAITAYALYVRELNGESDAPAAHAIWNRYDTETISLDVAAWLWPTLDTTDGIGDEIERLFNNRVTETANAATFATGYGEQSYLFLHSDRRTDAIVLDSFLRQAPDSDLVLKTLNGLLAARGRRGHWSNIQENSFILLAAGHYFEQFETDDPSFIARVWLGDTYALEQRFEGRNTDQTATLVPMAELVGQDGDESDVVIQRDGSGRLYYRLGLRYAPTDLTLEPRDQGFVVERTYEAVDDEADVTRNDDGTWTVRAGARVRIRVTMVADSRRTHVVLLDPMPAGFEAVNPVFATSEPIPPELADSDQTRFWWGRWFNHQNLRDDRAEAFTTWLRAGTYDYTYIARATTPGTFVTPPARAEQIYEPEVFGRSASTTVVVD